MTDLQERRRAPVVTLLLVASYAAVFLYEVVLGWQSQSALERFIGDYAVVPARFVAGWSTWEAWVPLLTAMTLHGGVAHVAGNAWFLWVFGRSVENRIGGGPYLVLYLLAGVAATLLQIAVEPGSRVPMLGASGAISGVLGTYFVLLPAAWVLTLVPWIVPLLPIPAVVFLALWFALQMSNGIGSIADGAGGAGGGIAWWAHAGGFVAGVALAAAWPRPRSGRVRRRRR